MHSILFALKKPNEDDHDEYGRWQQAAYMIDKTANNTKGAVFLNQGVVLLIPKDGMPLLGVAISEAESRRLSYRVIFIRDAEEVIYNK